MGLVKVTQWQVCQRALLHHTVRVQLTPRTPDLKKTKNKKRQQLAFLGQLAPGTMQSAVCTLSPLILAAGI